MAFYDCNDLNGIYYKGTPNDWNKINFIGYNDHIINAKRYYYSETKPTNVGNYWHYDENSNPIVW